MSEQNPTPAGGSAADTPVLDILAAMTAASLERTGLDPQTLMLVRLAALVPAAPRPCPTPSTCGWPARWG